MNILHIGELAGSFLSPDLITSFDDAEALDVALSVVPAIVELLSAPTQATFGIFHPNAFWRDKVSLTWSLRTFHCSSVIAANLVPLIQRAAIVPASIVLEEAQVAALAFPNGVSVVRVPFTFQTSTPDAQCTAAFKLIRMKNGDIRVFTVTTALKELGAAPWQEIPAPVSGPSSPDVPASLDVLVVGGGHGGLAISAYLKALNINFAMIEKQSAIGDSWAKRYDSTTLHTTRIFSGLPFIPFPSDYPQFVPAKLIAQYYANYVEELQLPAYPARECTSAIWDAERKEWSVTIKGVSATQIITARTLIFAVGVGGRRPILPDFPGQDSFAGESLHSATYKDASAWAGRRVAVVGSSTTACDVALDCVRAQADIMMIQRGPTRIYPQAHIEAMQAPFWNPHMPVEVGDIISSEDPIVLQAALSKLMLGRMRDEYDPEYYDSLRRVGFLATVEGSIHEQIYCRSGSHYPDVGACAAITRGEIEVKSDSAIERVTPTGLAFSDGSKLDVDVIVYATGFEKDSRKSVASILGAEQTAALEPVWGLDAEGEVCGSWRPSGHDRIWFQSGELQTMRYYGKFLAMQVAAELAGVRPIPCRRD